jgi:hypothetical protein
VKNTKYEFLYGKLKQHRIGLKDPKLMDEFLAKLRSESITPIEVVAQQPERH